MSTYVRAIYGKVSHNNWRENQESEIILLGENLRLWITLQIFSFVYSP